MSSTFDPIIQVQNLTAKYGEKTILEDISVDFMPNCVNVILGGSGCGKTTLLRNILRLEEPFAGSVKFWVKRSPAWMSLTITNC